MNITKRLISHNFDIGRNKRVEFPAPGVYKIVFHTMDGYGANCFNWFNKPTTQASAHYGVMLTGAVEQYVEDQNKAWHAGHGWWNDVSIGIEFDDADRPEDSVRTPQLYESGAQLVAYLCDKHGIDLNNRSNFELHRNIVGGRSCPGGLDVERILARAKEIYAAAHQPAPVPVEPAKPYVGVILNENLDVTLRQEYFDTKPTKIPEDLLAKVKYPERARLYDPEGKLIDEFIPEATVAYTMQLLKEDGSIAVQVKPERFATMDEAINAFEQAKQYPLPSLFYEQYGKKLNLVLSSIVNDKLEVINSYQYSMPEEQKARPELDVKQETIGDALKGAFPYMATTQTVAIPVGILIAYSNPDMPIEVVQACTQLFALAFNTLALVAVQLLKKVGVN